jgi:hypothetical protein
MTTPAMPLVTMPVVGGDVCVWERLQRGAAPRDASVLRRCQMSLELAARTDSQEIDRKLHWRCWSVCCIVVKWKW